MKRSLACLFAGFLAALAIGPRAAHAQSPLAAEFGTSDSLESDWGLVLTPYVFFASQSTDVGTQQIRQSFSDLATIVDAGFQGRLNARYKRLSLVADATFADLGLESDIGRTNINLKVKQWILDLQLLWPVFDNRSPDGTGGVGVWVGAGARYWSNDVLLDIVTQPIFPSGQPSQDTVEESQDWWDPELGVALHFPITSAVGFSVRATGGGFAIGDASDFMWDAEFNALFRVSGWFLVSAGYRQFRYSRTEGEGDDEIDMRVSAVGPHVGFSFVVF